MSVSIYQGIIENGQIVLIDTIKLPEKKNVYIVIPDFDEKPSKRIFSPRLVNQESLRDFVKTVEDVDDE